MLTEFYFPTYRTTFLCSVILVASVMNIPQSVSSESYSREKNWRCEKYSGQACAEVLGNQSIFLLDSYSQAIIEEKIVDAFTVVKDSPDLSTQCSKYAVRVMCFHNFAPCNLAHNNSMDVKALCRDECELLESDICNLEYTIAKKHPLLGKRDLLPICADLPPLGSQEFEKCIRLGVPDFKDYKDDTCYEDKGVNYKGTVSRSVANYECLPWSNGNLFKWTEYQELRGGHNFCRNPGGKMNKPWCYVDNQTNPIQYCNVSPCVDFMEFWLYVLIPVMAAVLIFSLIVCIWCMVYKVNIKEVMKVQEENKALEIHEELNDCRDEKLCSVNALEVPISNIKFCKELGEGAFGKVFKGQAYGLLSETTITPVAIKTLKINASHRVKQEFKREVELMAYLQHPNIICLLGVCINDQPLCMLFEFMSCGDLHEYLVSHFIQTDDLSIGDFSEELEECGSTLSTSLSLRDLLHISYQIAAGMEYLSSHHYVHRDLATRNCLVGDNQVVKISDFGLSRDIYSSDYYRVQSKSLLPVRWMPPESILYGKFTSESDVWSFGVVLWEIFYFGLQPYYGRTNQEVIDMIRSRQLLPCPPNCPPQVYGLMLQTWHALPSQRPTFRTLYDDLRLWFKVFSSVDNLNLSIAPSSVNGGSRGSTLNRRPRPTNGTNFNDLYTPWKPRPQPTVQPNNSYQHPAFIDERFEPRVTVV